MFVRQSIICGSPAIPVWTIKSIKHQSLQKKLVPGTAKHWAFASNEKSIIEIMLKNTLMTFP